jgi:hypothetical protein
MTPRNLLVASLIAAMTAPALAATAKPAVRPAAPVKKDSEKVYLQKVDAEPAGFQVEAPNVTLEDLKKVIEDSEKRRPASAVINEQAMSPELRVIRDRFLALKTSDDLAALLAELDARYDSLPTDAKFLAAQVQPVTVLRGIIYRLRNVFEHRSRAAHSATLTLAKNITTNFRIYLPQDSMKAVLEYFTSPYFENGVTVASFNSEADIQNLLAKDFAKAIARADDRIGKLDLSQPIVWDQRFSFGPDSFQDGLNRFRLVGELEKSIVRSAMMGTVASLCVLRAYNVNDTIDLSANIGRLYGIDGFLSVVDGVSAEKISNEIRKKPNIGTILGNEGRKAMKDALNAARWSSIHAMAAWQSSSKSRQNEHLYAVDSGYWRVNRDDLQKNLDIMYRVINSNKPEKIRSSVTGEVIEIDFAKFFTDPPDSLQSLLPLNKPNEPHTVTRMAAVSLGSTVKKPLTYRNYAEGSPELWNTAAYQTYLPSVKSNEDVLRVMRVLSHAGGSWLSIIP